MTLTWGMVGGRCASAGAEFRRGFPRRVRRPRRRWSASSARRRRTARVRGRGAGAVVPVVSGAAQQHRLVVVRDEPPARRVRVVAGARPRHPARPRARRRGHGLAAVLGDLGRRPARSPARPGLLRSPGRRDRAGDRLPSGWADQVRRRRGVRGDRAGLRRSRLALRAGARAGPGPDGEPALAGRLPPRSLPPRGHRGRRLGGRGGPTPVAGVRAAARRSAGHSAGDLPLVVVFGVGDQLVGAAARELRRRGPAADRRPQ